jgi:hypothetical protein
MQRSYRTWIPHAITHCFLSIELCTLSVNKTYADERNFITMS